MTRTEFVKCVAYLTAGSGKALAAESLEVYFDCLKDLTADIMATACKRVLMEHKFATFPSIAELREAAAETSRGEVKALASAEAWAIAWKVAGATDPEVDGSFERAYRGVPAIVVDAIQAYGLCDLCYGKEPVGVVRGQFLRIFEQLAAREKRKALMPPKLAREIEAAGKAPPAIEPSGKISDQARELLNGIGTSPNP